MPTRQTTRKGTERSGTSSERVTPRRRKPTAGALWSSSAPSSLRSVLSVTRPPYPLWRASSRSSSNADRRVLTRGLLSSSSANSDAESCSSALTQPSTSRGCRLRC